MIYFDGVSKRYDDDTTALDNVTLKIEPHEFVSIVGHSGAGKTTILKMLLHEAVPTEGAVYFQSRNIHNLQGSEIIQLRRQIGTIFQDFRLIQNKTVYENIAFAMEAAGRSDDDIETDVPYALELVDLSDKIWNFPHELSGGEQQRAAIARAIVNQPYVLNAYEPTASLDPVNTYEIVQILKKVNDLGTTVILTTHNKGVIDSLEKRVITMEKGRIVRDDLQGQYTL